MMKPVAGALLAAAMTVATAAPASAGLNRAWVSTSGSNVPACGSFASPCRTLQYTHDNIINDGGEIDIMKPGGYGAIAISKGVSIVNDGVGTAGVLATSGDAINITAPGKSVFLRGLNIDGGGTAGFGIHIGSVSAVTIIGCTSRNFVNAGLRAIPLTDMRLVVEDTIIADNANHGIELAPFGQFFDAVFTRVTSVHNKIFPGLTVTSVNYTGASAGRHSVQVNDSIISQNSLGIQLNGAPSNGTTTDIQIIRSELNANEFDGIFIGHSSPNLHAFFSRTQIFANGRYGINSISMPIYSDKTSRIDANPSGKINNAGFLTTLAAD